METTRRTVVLGGATAGAAVWAAPAVLATATARAEVSAAPPADPRPQVPLEIYREDFAGTVGPEWNRTVTTTTVGGDRVLGRFLNEQVTLALGALPEGYTQVNISFSLYIADTWDGNGAYGPDRWQFTGPTESFLTSFSNVAGKNQSFPDAYPAGSNPFQTDAVQTGNLIGGGHPDSRYALSFTQPFAGPSVAFSFEAFGLQSLGDESWALDDVVVTLVP